MGTLSLLIDLTLNDLQQKDFKACSGLGQVGLGFGLALSHDSMEISGRHFILLMLVFALRMVQSNPDNNLSKYDKQYLS